MKKEYKAPTVTSEPIKIGVFGNYGSNCGTPPIGGGEGHGASHNGFGLWPVLFRYKRRGH
jgi:hypothetical protein